MGYYSITVNLQSKNGRIALASTERKTHHRKMNSKLYELKIDKLHPNKQILGGLFLEAKWYHDDIIASDPN